MPENNLMKSSNASLHSSKMPLLSFSLSTYNNEKIYRSDDRYPLIKDAYTLNSLLKALLIISVSSLESSKVS